MKVIATAKSVRITSRKARLVADSVIGLPVAEALAVLSFTPRHAAKEVAKLQLLNTTRQLALDVENAFVDVLQAKDDVQLARDGAQARHHSERMTFAFDNTGAGNHGERPPQLHARFG